jgi:hypothetical protein
LPEQHTEPAQCANAELHQAHAAPAQHFFDIDPQPRKLLAIQENTAFRGVAVVLSGYPGRNDRSPGPQTLAVFTLGRPDLFLSPQGQWRIASQRDAYKSLSAANPR